MWVLAILGGILHAEFALGGQHEGKKPSSFQDLFLASLGNWFYLRPMHSSITLT